MAATKKALWGALEHGLTDACRAGAQHLVGMWGHPDQDEGPLAFAEKREPKWAPPRVDRGEAVTTSADCCSSRPTRRARRRRGRTRRATVTHVELRARADAELRRRAAARPASPGQRRSRVMLPQRARRRRRAVRRLVAGGVYVPLNPRLSDDEVAHLVDAVRPAAVVTTDEHAPGSRGSPLPPFRRPAPTDSVARISGAGTGDARPRRRARPVHVGHHRARRSRCRSRTRACSALTRRRARKVQGEPTARAKKPADAQPHPGVAVAVGRDLQRAASRSGSARRSSSWTASTRRVRRASCTDHQIRSTVLPPAAMAMLRDDAAITSLAPLKYVRSITAPLSPLQARRFHDRFGVVVLNGYGQTELGGEVVGWTRRLARVRRHPARRGRPPARRRARCRTTRASWDAVRPRAPARWARRRHALDDRSPATAGSAPATSVGSTTTGSCGSRVGSRT